MLSCSPCKRWIRLCRGYHSKSASDLAQKVRLEFLMSLDLDTLRNYLQTQLEKLVVLVEKKSNLKDVCSLLDLKSSKIVLLSLQFFRH